MLAFVGLASSFTVNSVSSFSTISSSKLGMAMSASSSTTPKPKLSIPPAICSDVPGTWAYDTMSRRVNEEILQRTYEDNAEQFESKEFEGIKRKFNALRDELKKSSKLTMLDELSKDAASTPERIREYKEWETLLEPFISKGDTWLSAPWMVTEFYVYRKLIQATGYWDKDNTVGYQWDPFYKQKHAGLVSSVGSAEPMLGKVLSLGDGKSDSYNHDAIAVVANIALWGNKMDLSLWPADASNSNVDIFTSILASASENLLHDDSSQLEDLCEKLRNKGGGNVDIIVDNAGFELITDLALGQYLIQSGIAKVVTYQLKSHPTFVSDALEKDLLEHIKYYATEISESDYPNAVQAGKLWQSFIDNGQWVCNENNFWCQPYPMWEMTEPLRSDMKSRCDLAFVKGDANYRRLLGDCEWDFTASFQDVVGNYFPCPVCALRTLKAEIGCGMDPEQIERAKKLDDQWMVNGRFGVIHFGTGA